MRRPAVDVALAYVMAHALHARGLLVFGHLQRPMDGVRKLRNVVGVNQQRIGKFVRRPREGAEDQRTALVLAPATNSLATRFIPSCSDVTIQKETAL